MAVMDISGLRADLGQQRKGPHDQPTGGTSWVQCICS